MTTSRQPRPRAGDGAITELPARADRIMARFHPYSSAVRLLLSLLLALVLLPASAASADLGSPFATVTGVCDPTATGESDFSTAPVASTHANLLERLSATGGPGDFYPYGDDADYTFSDGDVIWGRDAYTLPADTSADGRVYCDGSTSPVSYAVDFFDVPTTPVAFSGRHTQSGGCCDSDDLIFNAPGTARYVADLSLQQGAVDLSIDTPEGQRDQTFASSGQFLIGVLSPGTQDLTLTPQDGPQAQWTIALHALPVRLTSLRVLPRFARPGQIDRFQYGFEGDVSLTATIRNGAGQTVRTLAARLPVSASTTHSLVWDGLNSSGAPVRDGEYAAVFSWTDRAGYTGSATTHIGIDQTPPVVSILSKLPLPPSHGLVFTITDRLSGVASVKASIDGVRLSRIPASGGTVIYRPRHGWSRGWHTLDVIARDWVGNHGETIKRFRVRTPPTRHPAHHGA